MKKNMGTFDRIARTTIALVFVLLVATETVTGVVAWIAGILALVLLLTSSISFCPLYVPLHLSTRADQSTKH